jgi:hypothetical protein
MNLSAKDPEKRLTVHFMQSRPAFNLPEALAPLFLD